MRIVAPYTRLRSEVTGALDATGLAWEACDVSGSDEAYWWLLKTLWTAGETFVIVEHDVVVRRDSLGELADCPSPWCSFQVSYVGMLYAGLGCTKFDAELIRRYPDALDRIATLSDEEHHRKHWCRLDYWLQDFVLNPGGEKMCVHAPALDHLRTTSGVVRPSHGCW